MRLRRFISCVLAAITLFSLTACAGGNNSSKGMSDVTVEQTLKKLEPNATVTEGLAIYQTDVVNSGTAIAEWLGKVGIK